MLAEDMPGSSRRTKPFV